MKPKRMVALVGPHHAGKTGLAAYLIREWTRSGMRVGVIKRAARPLQFDRAGKDSARYLESGSERVITQAPGLLYTQAVSARRRSLEELARVHARDIDRWLVESYEPEQVPWVRVVRRGQPGPLPDRHCVATFGDRPGKGARPHFSDRRPRLLLTFLDALLEGRRV